MCPSALCPFKKGECVLSREKRPLQQLHSKKGSGLILEIMILTLHGQNFNPHHCNLTTYFLGHGGCWFFGKSNDSLILILQYLCLCTQTTNICKINCEYLHNVNTNILVTKTKTHLINSNIPTTMCCLVTYFIDLNLEGWMFIFGCLFWGKQGSTNLIPRPSPFFVLQFAFSIIYGSGRERKTGKAWSHPSLLSSTR